METIRSKVDKKIKSYIDMYGLNPSTIYLHQRDYECLLDELVRRFGKADIRQKGRCPHCGGSLFTYGGVEIRTIQPGDIILKGDMLYNTPPGKMRWGEAP